MSRLKIYNNATSAWEYLGSVGKALPTGDIVGTSDTQTLTNKTLTSPIISGVGATTAGAHGYDATNHTLLIGDGTTNNPIHIGHWQSWVPTFGAGFTKGNATISATYCQIGKTVFFKLGVVWGNTTSANGAFVFTLPITSVSYPNSAGTQIIGDVRIFDISVDLYVGIINWASTTTASLQSYGVAGTKIGGVGFSGTSPFTWVTGDEMYCQGFYEAA